MTKSTGSRAPRLPTTTECVVDGNGSQRRRTYCSEKASPGPVTPDRASPTSHGALSRPNDEELWSLRTVVSKTGLSRASIYRYVARNLFPSQRRIGPGRVAWLASEVRAWMVSRPFLDRRSSRGDQCSTDQSR
jgi:prophage regulatory protein